MSIINNVSDYIGEVSRLTKNSNSYVYRGENKIYPTSCVPNIFREHRRLSNFSFEKNILNKVRSEGLDGNQSYLLTAIEAQHGGFPSRLLDISYNALIALHFAVTPFYNRNEDDEDHADGQVFIIKIEDMLSPSSDELEKLYREELLDNTSIKNNAMLLAHQHKMVDFYSKNQRIKAQQGGFILFYGNEFRPLPDYMLHCIVIPSAAKATIRNELDQLFGISNAFVYPESNNLVSRVIKSTDLYANFNTFDNKDEVDKVLRNFERNLKHYVLKVVKLEEHIEVLEKKMNDKKYEELQEYCKTHHINYKHIPTKKQSSELLPHKGKCVPPSYRDPFNKFLTKMLVDEITKIECYIRNFYLDLEQSKKLSEDREDENFLTKDLEKLEKRFEIIVKKICADLNILLNKTEIRLTPYENIVE
mgnify:CR=1 FL=1